MIPKFQLRLQPKTVKTKKKNKTKMENQSNTKQGRTLFLPCLPERPADETGVKSGRRGPRGPYKKRAKMGYMATHTQAQRAKPKKQKKSVLAAADDDYGPPLQIDESLRSQRKRNKEERDNERNREMQIKEKARRDHESSCLHVLRSIVPGLSEKTDKTTVLEMAVQYAVFIKMRVDSIHDEEFSRLHERMFGPVFDSLEAPQSHSQSQE